MLKLKYLFDNRDLAMMLIENWDYDQESLNMFKYFRISSNAIYPFKNKGKLQFLRISPDEEKNVEGIEGEVAILTTLRSKGYFVPKLIESKNSKLIETKCTPWGNYHSIVLEGVGNCSLENTELNNELCFSYGSFLGEFHNISRSIKQDIVKRDKILVKLDSFEDYIDTLDFSIKKEFDEVRHSLRQLGKTESSYGLIHYDFELDNIMYDSDTSRMYAIDFDDSMIGWYGQDVERALRSLKDEIDSELYDEFEKSFLEGYESTGNSSSDYRLNKETYRRFADLYKYLRVTKSLEESWDNEPEWMQNLRSLLERRMNAYVKSLSE